jgi:hypothetical protein
MAAMIWRARHLWASLSPSAVEVEPPRGSTISLLGHDASLVVRDNLSADQVALIALVVQAALPSVSKLISREIFPQLNPSGYLSLAPAFEGAIGARYSDEMIQYDALASDTPAEIAASKRIGPVLERWDFAFVIDVDRLPGYDPVTELNRLSDAAMEDLQ